MANEEYLKRGNAEWWFARTDSNVDRLRGLNLAFDYGRWTDQTITALRQAWALAFTTQQIAVFLGFSKNSICGKAHRLKLPERPSPIIRSDDPDHPRRSKAPKRATGPTLPPLPSVIAEEALPPIESIVLTVPKVSRVKPIARMGVTVHDLRRASEVAAAALRRAVTPIIPAAPKPYGRVIDCCWPKNDSYPWRFCGIKSEPGRPYCEEHVRVAYHRVPMRAEALVAKGAE